ncbi:MAG: DUF898 domain-containing protein [Ignavibacteria bacterium]|nr:DUF898 domain-containing protein [Ignavibacteria bacterium]
MNYLYFATKAYRFNNLTVNNMPMVFDLQISLEAGKFFRYSLISMFTLGLFYPVMQNRRMKTLYSHLKIQEERFQYDGVDSEYLKLWIFGIFFTVCTLGIYVFWLRQELFNYKINHLKLENRRFRCEVQGSKYFKLCVTNALLIIFSACILYPFTRVRTARHFVNGIQFDNSESINDIALPLSNQELFHKGYEFPFSIGI